MLPSSSENVGGDVGGAVDVDHPVACSRRAGTTAKRLPLSATSSRCTPDRPAPSDPIELVDQPVALQLPDPADHGQAGVQVEGEGVLACFDDQTFEVARRSDRPVGPPNLS